jgi:catecholate siderophore receptor
VHAVDRGPPPDAAGRHAGADLAHGRRHLLSWKVGALYKPAPDGSLYVAFANSQLPPGSSAFSLSSDANNANNPIYKPQEGSNVEAGAKWDCSTSAWPSPARSTAARTERAGAGPDRPGGLHADRQAPRAGVELSAAGQLHTGWDLNLGSRTWTRRSPRASPARRTDPGRRPAMDAEADLHRWTPTSWPIGLTLGGGARYIDSVLRSSVTSFSTAQSGILGSSDYWVFDAMAAYDVSKNVTLQLNLLNLTDEEYIASMQQQRQALSPGAPRSAYLTANFKF